MINIELGGGYWLMSDEDQYIVGKKQTDKKGQARIKSASYFASIEAAIKYIGDLKLRLSDATTLDELMGEVKDVNRWAMSLRNDAQSVIERA